MVSGSVGVSSVVDVDDDNAVARFVDPVADSILASSGSPQPFEGCSQWGSDHAWLPAEGSADEFPGGEGGGGKCVG